MFIKGKKLKKVKNKKGGKIKMFTFIKRLVKLG